MIATRPFFVVEGSDQCDARANYLGRGSCRIAIAWLGTLAFERATGIRGKRSSSQSRVCTPTQLLLLSKFLRVGQSQSENSGLKFVLVVTVDEHTVGEFWDAHSARTF